MPFALNSKTEEATKCRIFIGNLPSDQVTKESMRQIFSQYGSYADCSIYKNFGFVQFNDEKSAIDAVKGTDKTKMFDRLLDVKIASMNVQKKDDKNPNAAKKRPIAGAFPPIQSLMSQNPQDPGVYANYDANYGAYGATPAQNVSYPNNYNAPAVQNLTAYPNYNPYTFTTPVNPTIPPFAPVNPIAAPFAAPVSTNLNGNASYNYATANPYPETKNPNDFYNYDAKPNLSQPAVPEKSDNKLVDIICYNKKLFQYGEFIEFTVSKFGLICNINILFNNYPIESLIKRCARESACAIILKEENETHRSISLHIFGANPEEHRNMPLDVAETFLRKKFGSQSQAATNQPTSRSFSYSMPSNYSAPVVSQAPVYSTAGSSSQSNYGYQNQSSYSNQFSQNYPAQKESNNTYYPSAPSSYNTGSQNYYTPTTKYNVGKSSGYKRT